ncbi:hypothetical protein ACVRZR_03050 [Streptococcus entericus]|uniref:hypothetical protein n=1 Tax=Streptococcus entericus TaxID=155680 RepID=UPI000369A758|nr:hypothetical protein [Streptococcus entericus]
MELREFKHWMIDKGFENDELFLESIKCYQVEAYKAAYIFSYLANHKYISETAIKYRGVPKSFMKNCPEEDVRLKEWQKKVELLKHEDSWEEEVNNLINADDNGKAGNIFALQENIRKYFPEMRNLRNVAAHAKDRYITESTVQELWNNIVYLFPNFVINGSKEDWLEGFDQIVKYSNYSSELLDSKIADFTDFSKENQLILIKKIIDNYLVQLDWDETPSEIVLNFLSKVLIGPNSYNKEIRELELTAKEEIYLSIVINGYLLAHSEIDVFPQFEELVKDYFFRYLCDKYPENFWKLVDQFLREVNESKLLTIIFKFLKNNNSVLLEADYKSHKILSENVSFLERVLEKISHLYYYTKSSTGQQCHSTSTFDYSKFYDYEHYMVFLFYKISTDSTLLEHERVKDFMKRCEKLATSDYSGKYWCSEENMQKSIRKINEKYKVLKEPKQNANTLFTP